MRTLLLTLVALSLAATVVAAAVTYRWVDADGVHYSDQPHAGAEKVDLGETQTYSPPAAAATPAATPSSSTPVRSQPDTSSAAFHYASCAVVQPAEDQVLIDVDKVMVAVRTDPPKRSGDHAVLYFDKEPVEPLAPDQTEFRISPIDRGTHIVSATIRGPSGETLCQSPAVSFHVRQPSMLAPLNPNNPGKVH